MIRKLIVLICALASLLAVSAGMASSASAAGIFECEVEPCVVTGTSEEGTKAKFSASGISVECTAHLAATVPTKTSAEITVHAEYTTGSCNQEAHVRMDHCDYVFGFNTTSGHGPVSISCGPISVIELETTAPNCILTFGAQTPAGGASYTTVSGATTTAKITLSKLKFTRHNPTGSFLCSLIPKEGEGSYQSTDTLTCFDDFDSPVTGTAATTTPGTAHISVGLHVSCYHDPVK